MLAGAYSHVMPLWQRQPTLLQTCKGLNEALQLSARRAQSSSLRMARSHGPSQAESYAESGHLALRFLPNPGTIAIYKLSWAAL